MEGEVVMSSSTRKRSRVNKNSPLTKTFSSYPLIDRVTRNRNKTLSLSTTSSSASNDLFIEKQDSPLIGQPELLQSGRPLVARLLAYRLIPPDWHCEASARLQRVQIDTDFEQKVSAVSGRQSVNDSEKRKAQVKLETPAAKRAKIDSGSAFVERSVDFSTLETGFGSYHFFCTFKHLSFLHTAWLPVTALKEEGVRMKIKLAKFLKEEPIPLEAEDDEEVLFNLDFVVVDKILAKRIARERHELEAITRWWPHDETCVKSSSARRRAHHANLQHPLSSPVTRTRSSLSSVDNRFEYLIKWSSLSHSHCTWERPSDFQDSNKIAEFERESTFPTAGDQARRRSTQRPPLSAFTPLKESTAYKNDNKLRSWQVEGVSWLLFNWFERRGSILADEMGLGKTVEVIAFLLRITEFISFGPFLIVVPLSTLPHWRREFERWSNLNVAVMQGSKEDRDIVRRFEWYYRDAYGQPKWSDIIFRFHVCLATFESLLAEESWMARVRWRTLVIDEAHRLKNKESRLFKALATFRCEHRIMLTGTPVQNNATELWTLLHFLEPRSFPSLQHFTKDFGVLDRTEQVTALQQRLKPYLLRRLKEDVARKIPKKEEIIIEVELTLLQKQYYRAVLEKNRDFLYRGCKGSNVPKLLNVVMQLRKVCSHPFLIEGVQDKETENMDKIRRLERLINASGKLVLIDKLLPKLHAGSHRVLIFSQLKLVLDLLADYLTGRGYQYERIDGDIRGNDRQAAIDRFCAPASNIFVFLLSTRAGGLGINLAQADTVIIYDSDCNPQNDMQAQARAHRIGQTQAVKVYRLVTSKTYEMEIFKRASLKLGLGQAILKQMQDSKTETLDNTMTSKKSSLLDRREVEDLLKFGAYDLFNEAADKASIRFCEEDIDQILQNRTKVITRDNTKPEEEDDDCTGSQFTFSKANFTCSQSDSAVDVHAIDFWDQVIPNQRSADKLTQRLDKREFLQSDANKREFLNDLFGLAEDIVQLHRQGLVPSNTSTTIEVLLRVSTGEFQADFTESERHEARDWIDAKRQRRKNMGRLFNNVYEEQIQVNGGETTEDSKNNRSSSCKCPLSRKTKNITRRERKRLLDALTDLAGLAPLLPDERGQDIQYEVDEFGVPHHPSLGIQPPIWDIWNKILESARFKTHSLNDTAAFCCAFLGYCASQATEEANRDIFAKVRTRLLALLPRKKAEQSFDLVLSSSGDNPKLALALKSAMDPNEAAPLDSLLITNDEAYHPTSSVRTKGVISNSKSEKVMLHSMEGSTLIDPYTATFSSFPAMADDVHFQFHVQKRVKRWAAMLRTQIAVSSALDLFCMDEKCDLAEGHLNLMDASKTELKGIKSKARGRESTSSSAGFEDEEVETESLKAINLAAGLRTKACSDPILATRLQRSFGSYSNLLIKDEVGKSPAWWWTCDDDISLLVGIAKHGTNYKRIQNDPLLTFLQRIHCPQGDSVHLTNDCSSYQIGCICHEARKVHPELETCMCSHCCNFFHLDCLERAREEATLGLSRFPSVVRAPLTNSESLTAEPSTDLSDVPMNEVDQPSHALAYRDPEAHGTDADELADETENLTPLRLPSSNDWYCDRCLVVFPSAKPLELRVSALCAALRKQHQMREHTPAAWKQKPLVVIKKSEKKRKNLERRLRMSEAEKRGKTELEEKQATGNKQVQEAQNNNKPDQVEEDVDVLSSDEGYKSGQKEESSDVLRKSLHTRHWTKKERVRLTRDIQLFGSRSSSFFAIRQHSTEILERKSNKQLQAFACDFKALCRYVIEVDRHRFEASKYGIRKKELRKYEKELNSIQKRIDNIFAKEYQQTVNSQRRLSSKKFQSQKLCLSTFDQSSSYPNFAAGNNDKQMEADASSDRSLLPPAILANSVRQRSSVKDETLTKVISLPSSWERIMNMDKVYNDVSNNMNSEDNVTKPPAEVSYIAMSSSPLFSSEHQAAKSLSIPLDSKATSVHPQDQMAVSPMPSYSTAKSSLSSFYYTANQSYSHLPSISFDHPAAFTPSATFPNHFDSKSIFQPPLSIPMSPRSLNQQYLYQQQLHQQQHLHMHPQLSQRPFPCFFPHNPMLPMMTPTDACNAGLSMAYMGYPCVPYAASGYDPRSLISTVYASMLNPLLPAYSPQALLSSYFPPSIAQPSLIMGPTGNFAAAPTAAVNLCEQLSTSKEFPSITPLLSISASSMPVVDSLTQGHSLSCTVESCTVAQPLYLGEQVRLVPSHTVDQTSQNRRQDSISSNEIEPHSLSCKCDKIALEKSEEKEAYGHEECSNNNIFKQEEDKNKKVKTENKTTDGASHVSCAANENFKHESFNNVGEELSPQIPKYAASLTVEEENAFCAPTMNVLHHSQTQSDTSSSHSLANVVGDHCVAAVGDGMRMNDSNISLPFLKDNSVVTDKRDTHSDAINSTAAWKVRRQLYHTSTDDIKSVFLPKLFAEYAAEVAKLETWNSQRLTQLPVKPDLKPGILFAEQDEHGFSAFYASRALSRVLVIDFARQMYDFFLPKPHLLCQMLVQVQVDATLPSWWTAEHDWATIRGVCVHGLGNIDQMMKDENIFSHVLQLTSTTSDHEIKTFLRDFLRGRSPLMRRLFAIWQVVSAYTHGYTTTEVDLNAVPVSSTSFARATNLLMASDEDLLGWLLLQRKEKTTFIPGAVTLNAHISSQDTMIALMNKDSSSSQLSFHSLNYWARWKESSLGITSSQQLASGGENSAIETESKVLLLPTSRQNKNMEGFVVPVPNASISKRIRKKAQPEAAPDCQNRLDKLPCKIREGITVESLGVIDPRPTFVSEQGMLWPVGFRSTRMYFSIIVPSARVMWTSEIRDGGNDRPLFVVTSSDDLSTSYTAQTASGAWAKVMKASKSSRKAGSARSTQSGPHLYGLDQPAVRDAIKKLPGAPEALAAWH